LRRSKELLAILALALCAIGFGVASATAEAPQATTPEVSEVSYASAHVKGEVDPKGQFTEWFFEVSTNGTDWERKLSGEKGGSGETGLQSVEGTLEGLKGGTSYEVRLGAMNYEEFVAYYSPEPNPEFTTLAVDAPAFAAADEASEVAYTTAKATGEVERPSGNANSAFDVNCRFEYITDAQFDENIANSAPGFENAASADCAENPVTAEGTKTPVSAELSGLSIGTTYHLRLHAENAGGVLNAEAPSTFTTLNPDPPAVTIDPITTFGATTATFSGMIDPEAPGGDPVSDVDWHFQCSPECPNMSITSSPTPNPIPADSSAHTVEAKATGLEPNTTYEVTLVGKNAGDPVEAGPVSFTTDAVVPEAETVPAFAIEGGTEALVAGRINPHNSATTYWIEYGPTAAYGNSAPVSEDASAGSGGSWQVFSQKVSGLKPSTVYHFRVVAESAAGPRVSGADKTFETAPVAEHEPVCPNATLRAENSSTELPDCRGYEQVSPVDKNGFDAARFEAGSNRPNVIAGEDGSSLLFESFGAFGDARSAPLVSQYLSRRGGEGWITTGVSPPQKITQLNGGSPIFTWAAPDLSTVALFGSQSGHVAPGDNPAILSNLYRFDPLTRTYQTLNVGQTQEVARAITGSADGSRIFFESRDALTPDAVEGLSVSSNLYEWHDGQLNLVSIILNSSGEEEPSPGGGAFANRAEPAQNEVSADGSRVFFTAPDSTGKDQLFLREDGGRTLKVSASRGGNTPEAALERTLFMGASVDGSTVFFQTTGNLTPDATGGALKVYRFEPETESLTNLLAGVLPGEPQTSGNCIENRSYGVLGVSQDGKYVYFCSHSRFNADDNPLGEPALYLWHNGTVQFIAGLNGAGRIDRNWSEYRLSPDGRRLSFSSTARLTAYDNTDSVPFKNGSPRQDREIYVFDAATDRLTCVSCNPSGRPPTGAPDDGPRADSFFPEDLFNAQTNPQPGVRNDGSIFFNSRDALVSQDVNGKVDVYQWKGGRVHLISSGSGGGDSFFASASVSGDDAFFVTSDRLVPSDNDDAEDIYDARVKGGFPRAMGSTACEGIEGCHEPARGSPAFVDPASSSFKSSLKQPLPKAERLHKALRACNHRKKKKAKAKCRAAAKKRYGKASNGRAH
jgi:hypothetical protein